MLIAKLPLTDKAMSTVLNEWSVEHSISVFDISNPSQNAESCNFCSRPELLSNMITANVFAEMGEIVVEKFRYHTFTTFRDRGA